MHYCAITSNIWIYKAKGNDLESWDKTRFEMLPENMFSALEMLPQPEPTTRSIEVGSFWHTNMLSQNAHLLSSLWLSFTIIRPLHLHVRKLPLVLLLSTFKSALGLCNLCLDGSTITRPDYFIGITDPILLNTCKDIRDALLLFPEDSDLCLSARALSALCGCPVAKNACSICAGSQNITRPQQLLASLMDFENEPAMSGLALTCALVESGMQVYYTGRAECLEQPFDGLHRYCGCPSEDGEESNACTLCCPGGEEIVPGQLGVDMFIDIGNEDHVSCEIAKNVGGPNKDRN